MKPQIDHNEITVKGMSTEVRFYQDTLEVTENLFKMTNIDESPPPYGRTGKLV